MVNLIGHDSDREMPFLYLIICLSLVLSCASSAHAADPGMRENEINGGWYGWIGNHEVGGSYDPAMNAEFLRRHHVNWYWLSHQWVVPFLVADMADVRETMIEESKRSRIWVELYWWGDHSTWDGFAGERNYPGLHEKLAASGVIPGGDDLTGKDWFAIADDPRVMSSVKKTIKWQLETMFEYVGEDAIYGVLLSEEEPDHGFYVTGTGAARYNEDPAVTKRLLVEVHNELYDYVKSLYPRLKVSPGFYPAWVEPGTLKADAIVMDNYPPPGFEEARFQSWIKAYGDIAEQYVLLWGYGNLDRELEVDRLHKIVNLYLDHGITNIGFFRPEFTLRDPIFRMFDTLGVGSYQPYDLEIHRRNVAALIQETKLVVEALGALAEPFDEPRLGDADTREALCAVAESVYAYREKLLDAAYERAVASRSWVEMGRLISLGVAEGWLPDSFADAQTPSAREIAAWEMLSKELRSLPDFYAMFLSQEAALQSLASAVVASLPESPGELLKVGVSINAGQYADAYRHAVEVRKGLVAKQAERSWEVSVVFTNPYEYVLNCEVTLTAEYVDGKAREVYHGIPFETVKGPTEAHTFYLPKRPIALTLTTGSWSGDVGVQELSVSNSSLVLEPTDVEHKHVRGGDAFLADPSKGFTLAPWASVSGMTVHY